MCWLFYRGYLNELEKTVLLVASFFIHRVVKVYFVWWEEAMVKPFATKMILRPKHYGPRISFATTTTTTTNHSSA